MDQSELAAATSWLHWLTVVKYIGGAMVVIGVAAEVLGDWFSEPYQKKVEDARKLEIAQLTERAAQLSLDLEKERQKTAPRAWTKEQFEAIQTLKDQVPAVGIISKRDCIECQLLADHLMTAFRSAGAEIYGDPSLDAFANGTGISVFLPPGSSLTEHPIVAALTAANFHPAAMYLQKHWPMRLDIPVIAVGEKFPQYLEFPYFPGTTMSFQIHPLKK